MSRINSLSRRVRLCCRPATARNYVHRWAAHACRASVTTSSDKPAFNRPFSSIENRNRWLASVTELRCAPLRGNCNLLLSREFHACYPPFNLPSIRGPRWLRNDDFLSWQREILSNLLFLFLSIVWNEISYIKINYTKIIIFIKWKLPILE